MFAKLTWKNGLLLLGLFDNLFLSPLVALYKTAERQFKSIWYRKQKKAKRILKYIGIPLDDLIASAEVERRSGVDSALFFSIIRSLFAAHKSSQPESRRNEMSTWTLHIFPPKEANWLGSLSHERTKRSRIWRVFITLTFSSLTQSNEKCAPRRIGSNWILSREEEHAI